MLQIVWSVSFMAPVAFVLFGVGTLRVWVNLKKLEAALRCDLRLR